VVEFSASEAAFTGFRVVRERPTVAAVWTLIFFAVSAGFGALAAYSFGAPMNKLIQILDGEVNASATAKILELADQLAPLTVVSVLLSLIVYPVLFAAMNRAVLRPSEHAFAYLRMGADELRQMALTAVFVLLFLAAYIAAIVAVLIVGALIALIGAGVGPTIASVLTGLVMAAAVVGAFCGLVLVAVRLSLASALTFATGRINPFGSWAMTRGRFWPMLGTYLLALALAALVWSLIFALTAASTAVIGGGSEALATLGRADFTSLATYFSPTQLAFLILSALSSALVWPVVLTPPVSIYRRLASSHGRPNA